MYKGDEETERISKNLGKGNEPEQNRQRRRDQQKSSLGSRVSMNAEFEVFHCVLNSVGTNSVGTIVNDDAEDEVPDF
jgi:hypothetical protein